MFRIKITTVIKDELKDGEWEWATDAITKVKDILFVSRTIYALIKMGDIPEGLKMEMELNNPEKGSDNEE